MSNEIKIFHHPYLYKSRMLLNGVEIHPSKYVINKIDNGFTEVVLTFKVVRLDIEDICGKSIDEETRDKEENNVPSE